MRVCVHSTHSDELVVDFMYSRSCGAAKVGGGSGAGLQEQEAGEAEQEVDELVDHERAPGGDL